MHVLMCLFYFWHNAVLKHGFKQRCAKYSMKLKVGVVRVKRRIMMLVAFVSIAFFVVLLSPVYADPIPGPYRPLPGPFDWLAFPVEVILSEAVAWIIGAEMLRRLSRVSRADSYKIMLLVMVVSFSIGLLFWKIFGWI